jgi:hypothetical protein
MTGPLASRREEREKPPPPFFPKPHRAVILSERAERARAKDLLSASHHQRTHGVQRPAEGVEHQAEDLEGDEPPEDGVSGKPRACARGQYVIYLPF